MPQQILLGPVFIMFLTIVTTVSGRTHSSSISSSSTATVSTSLSLSQSTTISQSTTWSTSQSVSASRSSSWSESLTESEMSPSIPFSSSETMSNFPTTSDSESSTTTISRSARSFSISSTDTDSGSISGTLSTTFTWSSSFSHSLTAASYTRSRTSTVSHSRRSDSGSQSITASSGSSTWSRTLSRSAASLSITQHMSRSMSHSVTMAFSYSSSRHSDSSTRSMTPSNTTTPSRTQSPSNSPSPSVTASAMGGSTSRSISEPTTQTTTETVTQASFSAQASESHSSSSSFSESEGVSSSPSESPQISMTPSKSNVMLVNTSQLLAGLAGVPQFVGVGFSSSVLSVSSSLDRATIPDDSVRQFPFLYQMKVQEELCRSFFSVSPTVSINVTTSPYALPCTVEKNVSLCSIIIQCDTIRYDRYQEGSIQFMIGPAPWWRLPHILWVNITITSHVGGLSGDKQLELSHAASAVSVFTFNPLLAQVQSRAAIMAGLVVCQWNAPNPSYSILGVGVGINDPGFYYRGAIAGNSSLLLIVLCVPVTICVLIAAAARPKRRLSAWNRSLEILHLPSVVMIPGQLMLQPTIAAATALIVMNNSTSDIAIACFGFAICFLFLTMMTYMIFRSSPVIVAPRPPIVHRFGWVLSYFQGSHHWYGERERYKSWKRRNYYTFAHSNSRVYSAAEIWIESLLAVLGGVVVGKQWFCIFHSVIIMVVYTGLVIVNVMQIPMLSQPIFVMKLFVFMCWVGSACCAMSALVEPSVANNATLLDGSLALTYTAVCLSLISAVPQVIFAIAKLPTLFKLLWEASEHRPPRDAQPIKREEEVMIPIGKETPPPTPELPPLQLPPPPPLGLPPPPKRPQTVKELSKIRCVELDFFDATAMTTWTVPSPDVKVSKSKASSSSSSSSSSSGSRRSSNTDTTDSSSSSNITSSSSTQVTRKEQADFDML